jgi:tetratricopeptide (TPR) repeat protein
LDLPAIQSQFWEASQLANRGDYRESAKIYELLATTMRSPGSPIQPSDLQRLLRSVCFNLAQVLNKMGEYKKALDYVQEGLNLEPTDVGRAIALSARGEALYGIGRIEEATLAFREASLAHPIVGRLNSADSMARLGSSQLLVLAEQWVEHVVKSFARNLSPQLWSEVDTIRGRIAAYHGDYPTAKLYFESALRADPASSDAKLQLSLLTAKR